MPRSRRGEGSRRGGRGKRGRERAALGDRSPASSPPWGGKPGGSSLSLSLSLGGGGGRALIALPAGSAPVWPRRTYSSCHGGKPGWNAACQEGPACPESGSSFSAPLTLTGAQGGEAWVESLVAWVVNLGEKKYLNGMSIAWPVHSPEILLIPKFEQMSFK